MQATFSLCSYFDKTLFFSRELTNNNQWKFLFDKTLNKINFAVIYILVFLCYFHIFTDINTLIRLIR